MKSYEINEDTMAIIPISYYQTRIIEKERELIIEKKTYEIMEESCIYYGSTINGRIKAAKEILDCPYKTPLLVEESENIVFFPTKSAKEEDCLWINNNFVDKIIKQDAYTSLVFTNGYVLDINISKLSLQNQISRSARYENILNKRKLSNK